MNTIYKSILVLSLGLISIGALAQRQDSTLTRQVLLERDYNPTLNEATKINTAPNIFSPKIQPASSVRFLDDAPQLTLGATKLGQVASGDIRTDVPFSKQRFYLNIGAGSHGNIDGTIGVRAVDTQNDKLDIFASHSSLDGNVDYAHTKTLLKKAKAKFADTKANVKYRHNFVPSILTIGASYQNMGYNYYGNPLYIPSYGTELTPETKEDILGMMDMKTKQKVDVISVNAGFKSSDANAGSLKYEANIAYTNFKSKYGYLPTIDKGPRGGIIDANVNFYTALGIGNIGIAGGILNQSFASKDAYNIEGVNNFRGYTNFTVNPYYKIEELTWDLTIGANLNYVHDEKNKFVVTPNITAQFHINEVNTIYAGITGGVNNNTFIDILQENRYASPASRVDYSRTNFDIKVGFKSGIIPNLEFDIFAGYKQVKNDHMFAAFSLLDFTDPNFTAWSNVGLPVYDKVSTGHVGGLLKTKLIPFTTLSAKVVGYFYNTENTENDNKAWGRPTFTAELSVDVKPIDKLTVSLNYLLMAGRKGISLGAFSSIIEGDDVLLLPNFATRLSTYNMKNVSELNIGAEFEIIKWLSIHARVNNLLNQKYEQHLGYTLQGINVLGGFNLKF